MTTSRNREASAESLRLAVVLGTTEDGCSVFAEGRPAELPWAGPFPGPRTERVSPGHLVAIAAATDGSEVVIWRWFDAVVQAEAAVDGTIRLWEPGHGSVAAVPRDAQRHYRPGSRAYLSAGLPGAEWWVAGPVVDKAEDADVDLDEVAQFFTELGLWAGLT